MIIFIKKLRSIRNSFKQTLLYPVSYNSRVSTDKAKSLLHGIPKVYRLFARARKMAEPVSS